MAIAEVPSTMKTKSVRAGLYTAPPVATPMMRLICGTTPDALTLRKKIPPKPTREPTPSWIRAPPPSKMPMTGAPASMARSISLWIFAPPTSPRLPPMTVGSCAKTKVRRPATVPQPATMPSP